MDYVVWSYKDEGNSCMLMPPVGIDRDWELHAGVSRLAGFPTDATFQMSSHHRKNVGLTDNLMNLRKLIVASERLRRFLEERALKNVEYLPVQILDHKGRVASGSYVIVNPTEPQDCLDIARSGCTYSHIIPTDIVDVTALVLDPSRIETDVHLFRVKHFGYPVIVRRSLAEEILRAGFKGVQFIELDDYGQ